MRTAFFTVGTILATMANLPSAMELDSNTDAEAPANLTLAADSAAEWAVH